MTYSRLPLTSMFAPLALSAMPAIAQETAADAFPESQGLEEIVVTSQRRAEKLQSVPVTVSAFNEKALERLAVGDAIGISKFVPGMISQHNAGLASANAYFLRGLGNSQSTATFDAPVTTYVDDIYIARQNANNYAFFDTERVEVLRGPQGTLFGRNTTGGALAVIMRKPSDTAGMKLEMTGGSFERYTVKASADLPVSDKVRTKLSGFMVQDRGYLKNITTGDWLNGEQSYGIRGDVRFLLTDALTIDLSAEFTSNSSTYTGLRNVPGTNPYIRTATTRPVFYESAAGLPQTGCTDDNVTTLLTTGAGNCNLSENFAFGGNVNYELDNGAITYIFGYRHLDQGYINEYNASAVNKFAGFILTDNAIHEQNSHELKLNYAFGDTIDLVTGLFYLKETSDDRQTSFSGGTTAFRPIQDALYKHKVETAAYYAQADFHATEKLTLTLGGRYTWEKKNLNFIRSTQFPTLSYGDVAVTAFGIPLTQTVNRFTPRFAVDYKFTPEVMAFASVTNGFKSGGWNGTASAPQNAVTFNPEKTWSYEAGIKSELFDRKLRFNLTGYYAKTKDLQVTAGVPNSLGVIASLPFNAGTLDVYGVEMETTAKFGNLSLFANPSFMKGRYVFISPLATTLTTALTPTRVPTFQFSGGASYDIPVASLGGYFTGSGTWRHNSPYWVAVLNTTTTTTENFVDAAISFTANDESYRISFEVSNLTDQETVTANFLALFPGDPRRFTGRIKFKI
ncbi:TonB-dependent receptor [Novosphingobium sp. AAP83]|uniref:TonB-dependent receptor n=1 Tax=Novosphingobium sp. AAP83 TaxID=1523425 RepID=UPI0006B9B237|nr:TonB-dependent receptor [Novosphingobium sp. AAP83]KPF90764.1 TonB-dependent receptor [Novosphingobium sp. AAP83]